MNPLYLCMYVLKNVEFAISSWLRYLAREKEKKIKIDIIEMKKNDEREEILVFVGNND